MRARSTFKWLFGVGILAYVASAAAQTPPPAAPAATGTASDAQVGFQRKTQLTPQEQVVEARKHLARMEGGSAGIRKMLEEARKLRDVVKTLCLNDKLSQSDVAVRSARDRLQQLQAAVGRNDVELSNHEFTILTVLRQRVEQLVAEANQCIGEESAFIGDTKTTVQIDPGIAPDDTPYPDTNPTLIVGPPQCTSCSL
jgi:DNA-binding FrmR family transcriptional regulator